MNYHLFTVLLSILIFTSCNNESTGPCDYYNYEILAKVVSVEPYKDNGRQLYHVALQFNGSNLSKELQYLEKIKNIEIDSTFITKNKISEGYSYMGTVSEIKEGNCVPVYVSFDYNFKN